MNDSEFDVIKKYFSIPSSRKDVVKSVGDDCAVVTVPTGKRLLVTTDTLISGVHFPIDTSPEDIAYKSLMVNLSDLAAMGATPAWLTLAITLPRIDDSWLATFSRQFSTVVSDYKLSLIGGDTTKGPLSITIQLMGLCDEDKILYRHNAKPGDKIFVTGDLGDAAIGLKSIIENTTDEKLLFCQEKLNRPEARVSFAKELTRYSSCAIDLSDGLAADLGHVLAASRCGASINLDKIPLSSAAQYYFKHYHKSVIDWSMVLAQGDDYELCFTAASANETALKILAEEHQLKLRCIGAITESKELEFVSADGELVNFTGTGFRHF